MPKKMVTINVPEDLWKRMKRSMLDLDIPTFKDYILHLIRYYEGLDKIHSDTTLDFVNSVIDDLACFKQFNGKNYYKIDPIELKSRLNSGDKFK